jgi:hypothetical protein
VQQSNVQQFRHAARHRAGRDKVERQAEGYQEVTTTEHIRESVLSSRGVVDRRPVPGLDDLRRSEWAPDFEQAMRSRLIIGALRYGLLRAAGKPQYNRVKSIHKRIDLYLRTGNLEHLVDVANMALLEFVEGEHPKKHFHAQDDSQHTEAMQ